MRINALAGLVALVLPFAIAPAAHADWRENILGNRSHDSGSLGGGAFGTPKPQAAKKAAKTGAVKTASLGSTGYTAAKAKTYGDAESFFAPKPKKTASSSPGSGPYKYPSKNQIAPTGSTLSGQASYYWQPQQLASGGTFNPSAMTAAHKTLPFGTKVRVTNQRNGQSVVVTINDRGPYIGGRIIDLSSGAAGVIGMKQAGVVPVKVAVLGK